MYVHVCRHASVYALYVHASRHPSTHPKHTSFRTKHVSGKRSIRQKTCFKAKKLSLVCLCSNSELYQQEASDGSVHISGLVEETVTDAALMKALVRRGSERRQSAAHRLNNGSSRSHALFQVGRLS